MADAIPPPPDLKTLLRQSASDYRAMTSSASVEERELARKEREIIETLEKEEQERMSSSSASANDRSHDGAEYEMTAEIDQLAREWQMDAMGVSSWKTEKYYTIHILVQSPINYSNLIMAFKFNPISCCNLQVVNSTGRPNAVAVKVPARSRGNCLDSPSTASGATTVES